MRRIALAASFVAFALLGCKGCDDTAGTTNNDSTPQACHDRDGDGWAAGLLCDGPVDCDDDDADVNQDAEEVCDGVDNDCDGEIDEGCVECDVEGATRDCGEETGRCKAGTQTCTDGKWSACEGSEGPFSEICNGEDDDCDGEVDENPDLLCNDGVACNGIEVCSEGQCQAEAVDCSHLDGPCTTGMCSEKDGGCKAVPLENGTACDDGLFCTEAGVCSFGVCETSPRDCTAEADQCNVGVCDEDADACVKQPVSDGTSCDDGEFCTVSDTCTAGSCGGAERDCSAASDQCNTGICDETSDSCLPSPVADDTACDDGQYCNVGESCQAGQCTGGTPRECSAQGGSCRTGTCDEATDSCTGDPVPDGTACDNNEFCTVNDTCVAGTCTRGDARDCSSADGVCKVGSCSEALNQCVSNPAPDGSTCDDGAFCTENDTCTAGSCTGSPRNCDSVADACNTGSCDESAGACVQQPVSDGTACPDDRFCTVMEVCLSGTCDTQPRDCSAEADQCNDGLCDETTDTCVAQPVANGTPCEDGRFCTAGDTCTSGACIGGSAPDCSTITGGDPCLVASCDVATDTCIATNDPLCCDVTIDADLDGYNQCEDCDDTNGAIHPGATETCNGADDDCDGKIDEDFDADGDGYATCSDDPFLRDCDDTNPDVNPGMAESCDDGMGTNTGNGIDDNCNGYIDEGCNPCTTTDLDGDGWSECDGDCDDSNSLVYPGAPEICDGVDNDCNIFTVQNCGVSDTCNWDLDGDGDPSNDPDQCADDMLCACLLQGKNCTGDYRCTSFCNSSDTGPLGDGCQSDQTCGLDLLYSANVHGCSVNTDAPGTKRGGEDCSDDSECRSLDCRKLCTGPGPVCGRTICHDLCTNDAECGAGAVCRIQTNSASLTAGGNMDGRCWPVGEVFLGTTPVGDACTADGDCDHGKCVTDPNTGSQYCTEPCCTDSNCAGGFTCSFRGDSEPARVYFDDPDGTRWDIVETTPQCIDDVAGQGARRAGQVCTQNSECVSNFCEANLGVCVEPCCADSTCPTGLTCELQFVEASGGTATQARICVNISTESVFQRK